MPLNLHRRVTEGDYKGLIEHLALTMTKPITKEMREKIEAELSSLWHWRKAVDVIESMCYEGASELRQKLWVILLEKIELAKTMKEEVQEAIQKYRVPEWEQAGPAITAYFAFQEEVDKWLNIAKISQPLEYAGEKVVYRPDGFSTTTARQFLDDDQYGEFLKTGLSVEMWKAAGRPKTYCVLIDIFMNGLSTAIDKEYSENATDHTVISRYIDRARAHFVSEREKQSQANVEEKRRQMCSSQE